MVSKNLAKLQKKSEVFMALLKVKETPEEMQKDFEELDFYQQV